MGGNNSQFNNKSRKQHSVTNGEQNEILEIWECEEDSVSSQDALTLMHFSQCRKTDGHQNYIPVSSLCLEHIPQEIRTRPIFDYILAQEKLVVKIKVKKTSSDRPKARDSSKQCRCASGYVWCTDEKTIRCKCPNITGGHDAYNGLVVYTNKHVVFDNYEANNSEVQFFYIDSTGTDTTHIVRANGCGLREHKSNKDLVGLKLVYHDQGLYNKVSTLYDDVSNTWDKIPHKEKLKDHAIIISHPHGAVKQVSFGKLFALEREDEIPTSEQEVLSSASKPQVRKVTRYDAQTCEGSSGAPVLTAYYPLRPFTHSAYNIIWKHSFSVSY